LRQREKGIVNVIYSRKDFVNTLVLFYFMWLQIKGRNENICSYDSRDQLMGLLGC
jgi:hypothetical protein